MLRRILNDVPQELCELRQWVAWKWEQRDGNATKVPVDPKTLRRASTTDEGTWVSFEEAVSCVEQRGLAGVGFVFTENDWYAGVDLDDCRSTETGEIESWAADLIGEFDTYTEVSPSGRGVKMFVRGKVPGERNRQDSVEMYSQERFFTVTGEHLSYTPAVIKPRRRVLADLYRELFEQDSENVKGSAVTEPVSPPLEDEEVLNKLRSESGSEKFERLWSGDTSDYGDDDSRADQGLCSKIAFYTQVPEQIDRLFRRSGLYRQEKWGKREDYRRRTIEVALQRWEFWSAPESAAAQKGGNKSQGSSSLSRPLVRREGEDNPAGPLRVVRFSDLAPVEEKRRYVVAGLLPARFPSVVYGEGGSAKSLIAASISQAVARGDDAWMEFPVEEPGPCLYVDFELDEEEQNRRMRQLALGHDPNDVMLPEGLYYLCAAAYPVRDVLQKALDFCYETGVRLMVLDSMGVALQGDAEASRDVIGFFRNYVDPFRAAEVPILIVDHQSKKQYGESYHDKSPFGSVYKGNLTRSVIQVEPTGRAEDELTVRVRHQKANFGAKFDPFEITLRFNEAWVRLEKVDMDATDLASEGSLHAADRVRIALQDGPAYPDGLVDVSGLEKKTIQNALTKLKRKGIVEETGNTEGLSREVRLSSSLSLHTTNRDEEDDGEDEGQCSDDVIEIDFSK